MAAGLTAFEKYLDSWRLNHPDFGNVRACPYTIGVITDFKKVSDDPIQVISQVKVQIEGMGESDYIPLFYHPKAKFWDCVDFIDGELYSIPAQTFQPLASKAPPWVSESPPPSTTPEPGSQAATITTPLADDYFVKAWMSFRIGDEVAVMLQEGVPVAVLGFADGAPRIGEILFKMTSPDESVIGNFITAILQDTAIRYPGFMLVAPSFYPKNSFAIGVNYGADLWQDAMGPDGLALGLVQECNAELLYTEVEDTVAWTFLNWVYIQDPNNSDYTYWYDFWWQRHTIQTYYHYLVTLRIGPLIYKMKFIMQTYQAWDSLWSSYLEADVGTYNTTAWHQTNVPNPASPGSYGYYWEPETPPPHFWYQYSSQGGDQPPGNSENAVQLSWADIHPMDYYCSDLQTKVSPPPSCGLGFNWPITGSYWTSNYIPAAFLANPQTGTIAYSSIADLRDESWFVEGEAQLYAVRAALYKDELVDSSDPKDFIGQTGFTGQFLVDLGELTVTKTDPVRFFVRPHTKPELQAADMWPPGLS